jgi:hypothetical protein
MAAAGRRLNVPCRSVFTCQFLLERLNCLSIVFENALSNTVFMIKEWN